METMITCPRCLGSGFDPQVIGGQREFCGLCKGSARVIAEVLRPYTEHLSDFEKVALDLRRV